jgi:hypothetical protein
MRRLVLLLVLGGCPTLDLGDPPVAPPLCRPSVDALRDTVWAAAVDPPGSPERSCVAMSGCHAQATGRSALRLIPTPSGIDWDTNLDEIAQFLDCASPSSSLFITKPETGVEPHLGGDLWTCDSASCEPIHTVEEWIAGQ